MRRLSASGDAELIELMPPALPGGGVAGFVS